MNFFGISFESGRTYVVKDRATVYSTEKERSKGFFKDPQLGVHESHSIGFHVINSSHKGADRIPLGVYITGFTENCPFYANSGLSKSEITKKVKELNEHIVKPYEQKLGRPGMLNPSDHTFWKAYRYRVSTGDMLIMDNVEHRMALYFALLNGVIVSPKNEGNPNMIDTPYKIEDSAAVMDEKDKFMEDKYDAHDFLDNLIEEDFESMLEILKFVNLHDNSIVPDKKFIKQTIRKCMDGRGRVPAETLISVAKKVQTKEGKEQIHWTSLVKDMLSYGVIGIKNQIYMFNVTRLGASIDDVVYKIRGNDSTFDEYTRNEILEKLQAEILKRNKKKK